MAWIVCEDWGIMDCFLDIDVGVFTLLFKRSAYKWIKRIEKEWLVSLVFAEPPAHPVVVLLFIGWFLPCLAPAMGFQWFYLIIKNFGFKGQKTDIKTIPKLFLHVLELIPSFGQSIISFVPICITHPSVPSPPPPPHPASLKLKQTTPFPPNLQDF